MIKLKTIYNQLLFESNNTPLIVVDIQPAYESSCRYIISPLCEYINRHTGKIMILFNGEDLALDSKNDVQTYYIENGLEESMISHIIWREKIYGYFRDLMDIDIDPHIIKKVIRDAIIQKVTDSRDFTEEYIENIRDRYELDLGQTPFFMPDIAFDLLHQFRNGYICGGGKHECLKEITLLLNALNFKYTELQRFIY